MPSLEVKMLEPNRPPSGRRMATPRGCQRLHRQHDGNVDDEAGQQEVAHAEPAHTVRRQERADDDTTKVSRH